MSKHCSLNFGIDSFETKSHDESVCVGGLESVNKHVSTQLH